MNILLLKQWLRSYGPQLLGTRLGSITGIDARSISLTLYRGTSVQRLLLSARESSPVIGLLANEPVEAAEQRFAPHAERLLSGGTLVSITQEGFDRSVDFEFRQSGQFGRSDTKILRIELVGRSSNVFLLTGERTVIDQLKRVHEHQNRVRRIRTGHVLPPPPPLGKYIAGQDLGELEQALTVADVRLADSDAVADFISRNVAGGEISLRACFAELVKDVSSLRQLEDLITKLQSGELSSLLFAEEAVQDLNAYVTQVWRDGQSLQTPKIGPLPTDFRRRQIAAQLELARQADVLEDLAGAMMSAAEEVGLRNDRGRAWLREWQLMHPVWSDEVELTLPLEENARRLVRYSRRLKRAVPRLEAMLAVPSPQPSETRPRKGPQTPRASRLAALALQFQTTDGLTVACGRNAKANDELVRLLGSSRHLWFHARDYSGSHVILFSDGREVPQSSLEQAAVIAAYHSKGRREADVDVSYLPIRLLRRPKGGKPGQVLLTGEKTICVRPDAFRDLQDRLWRAVASEGPD